jgi:hypothetical protein
MREAALSMTTAARMAGASVIVSGSDVTDHSELYLSAGAHACALGEGDHTVQEWVAWLADGHENLDVILDRTMSLLRGYLA